MVTDSVCDLPKEIIEKFDIHIVPIYIKFGDMVYRDGIDITPNDVYHKLRDEGMVASTSSPSPGDFHQVFQRIADKFETILTITLSSKLTAVFQNACIAKNLLPEKDIRVFDSGLASIGEGFLIWEAAKAIKKGLKVDEIVALLEKIKEKIKIFATIDVLKYLYRSGRVPALKVLLGSTLKIKPILTIQNGEVKLLAKIVSRAASINYICKQVVDLFKNQVPVRIAVIHALCEDVALDVKKRLEKSINCIETIITEVTPVIGAYVGPGLIGIIASPVIKV
ncbi:MAG: DegV family protein [Actinobacteria bacterium]|nr:DegV family protein [Actinomycetota bacterium]